MRKLLITFFVLIVIIVFTVDLFGHIEIVMLGNEENGSNEESSNLIKISEVHKDPHPELQGITIEENKMISFEQEDISKKINTAKREIERRNDVIEADIVKKGNTISIAIIIHDDSESEAKSIGKDCLRLAITFIDKENPGSTYIGYTEFDYLIGVYLQDGTELAFGAKAANSRVLVW